MRAAPVQERDEHGHHDRRAAHEHPRDGGLCAAFGGEDGQVEADHADGREQGQAAPLAGPEPAQPPARVPSGERGEEQAGQPVAQELAAGVRIVAQDAVGGEGPADEHTGESGEEGAVACGVHDGDAREVSGPV